MAAGGNPENRRMSPPETAAHLAALASATTSTDQYLALAGFVGYTFEDPIFLATVPEGAEIHAAAPLRLDGKLFVVVLHSGAEECAKKGIYLAGKRTDSPASIGQADWHDETIYFHFED
jgi:hypothetical protein